MTAQRDYVTIVSGLPRSGTSMMMQMIDKGGIPALVDDIRKADEDNPRGYYEFEPVKQTKKDPSWLREAPGKVVKMVHMLLLDLPTDCRYRVIFMRRNIKEVVTSQNVMLRRHGKNSDDLPEDKLTGMFEAQLAKVDKYMRDNPCFRVLSVRYNDVLKDPRPAVAALNEFLGGDLNTQAMLAVVDPSLYRNRA
ncbi:MAG TPA: sulfotransferase domain-containing protein [Phycisphaerae bacterium]|nr:sulfotransferase domain-containing protein [Phycisphaerae bacterium]